MQIKPFFKLYVRNKKRIIFFPQHANQTDAVNISSIIKVYLLIIVSTLSTLYTSHNQGTKVNPYQERAHVIDHARGLRNDMGTTHTPQENAQLLNLHKSR
jgi:hypothetical protein